MCRSRRSSRIASMRIISPSAASSYRSGCTWRVVPSSSSANARATSRLPTPCGPWKRYACAGPSASAASSSRFASACSSNAWKVVADMGGDLLGWERAIEGDDALGEQLGQPAVALGDRAAEVVVLALDPVEAGRVARPRRLRVDVEDEGAIRQQALCDGEAELEHALGAEAARDPLVDDRGVDVAVADDGRAALECRPDPPRHVLGAGGGEQCRLRPGAHLGTVEHERADRFAYRRPARLARRDDVLPGGAQAP